MIIDRVKYTRHVRESDEWIGLEATLVEGEDDKQALRDLKQRVESFINEPSVINRDRGMVKINENWCEVEEALETFAFQEDALYWLKINGYSYFKELIAIAISKPLKKPLDAKKK